MEWKSDLKLEEAEYFLEMMRKTQRENNRKECYFNYHGFLVACHSTFQTLLNDSADYYKLLWYPERNIPENIKSLEEQYLFVAKELNKPKAIAFFSWIVSKSFEYEQTGIRKDRNKVIHQGQKIDLARCSYSSQIGFVF